MSTTTAIARQEDREAIFQDMDKVTQEIAIEGSKKLQTGFQVALLVQHDLGTMVHGVFTAEHLNEAQRKQEIRKLAAFWNLPNLTPTTIYDLVNVSTAFTREFVKAQVEEKMSNGGYLTWNHFKELQKIGSEKRQLALLKNVRRHSWSANELALEIQGTKEAEIKRSGGRKPKLPKTPVAMLQKIYTTVQLTDNYLEAVSEPLDGIFMEMPPQEVSMQFVNNIENTLERMNNAKIRLSQTIEKLTKVLERSQTVQQKQVKVVETDSVTARAAKKSVSQPETPDIEIVAPWASEVSEAPEAPASAPVKRQLRGRSPR